MNEVITLTESAKERLKLLNEMHGENPIRLTVKGTGCSGNAYQMDFSNENNEFDEVIEGEGFKLIVDVKAIFAILGTELDWEENGIESKFVFKNPNVVALCGCGESFSLK